MTVRVGIVGGGLITQAVHLPLLASMPAAFAVLALAEPSPTVLAELGRRYAIPGLHEDWRDLVARGDLDAIVVCSPNHTHAEVVLAALDQGLHVLVEKPLCLAPDDAQRIVVRQRETGRVVQVGYMKRFDPAYRSLLEHLAPDPSALRFVDVVTHDPGMAREPFVPWSRMVHALDVPGEVVDRGRASESRQVGDAIGTTDPAHVRAYSDTFLGALIHDVNLVHGVIERLGIVGSARPVAASHWNGGRAAAIVLELPGGARWHGAWLLLPRLDEFRESVLVYLDDAIHRLEFPAPYFTQTPTLHEVTSAADGDVRRWASSRPADAYRAQLEHFHACIVDGVACLTPPAQGAADVTTLRDLFRDGVLSPAPQSTASARIAREYDAAR